MAIHADAELHRNFLMLENCGMYNQNWFPNGMERGLQGMTPIINTSAILEDDLWSGLLSQSPLRDDEMPDRESPLAQSRDPGSFRSKSRKFSEVVEGMDAEIRHSETSSLASENLPQIENSGEWCRAAVADDDVRKRRRPDSVEVMGEATHVERSNSEQDSSGRSATSVGPNLTSQNSPTNGTQGAEISLERSPDMSKGRIVTNTSSVKPKGHLRGTGNNKTHAGSPGRGKSGNSSLILDSDNMVSPSVSHFLQTDGKHGFWNRETSAGKSPGTGGGHSVDRLEFVEKSCGVRMVSTSTASLDSSLAKESRWAEQLLLECANAIGSKNFVRMQHIMWVLNDLGCLTGDANQRLAAYGLKALYCKISGSAGSEFPSYLRNPFLEQANAGPKSVHRALLKFHDVNPWHQMVYTVANSVMIDNFAGGTKLHVIDIGVSQGTQWPTFIEALATRASGPPSLLRLTLVKDEGAPFSVGSQLGPSTTDYMSRLERFAKLMGINIELNTVVSSLQALTRGKLGVREGEDLAICVQFRLHTLPETVNKSALDEGCGEAPLSLRDSFLQFLHSLDPKVLVLSENDTDHLSQDFLTRFRGVVDFFWKFLDSTSFSFHGKQCEEREIIEHEEAMLMVNNIAYDGEQRIKRNETHVGWTARLGRAGFVSVLPREEVLENTRALIRKYDSNWEYGIDMDCVILLWKHQPVTFCSVWKTS